MRILIVEDQEKLAKSIKKGLENVNYTVDVLYDGESGLRRIMATPEYYDLVILDIMLPGINGLSVCQELRNQKIMIPIIILTARSNSADKVFGLDIGSDDYISKPFEFTELVSRIKAVLRRPRNNTGIQLVVQNITLDTIKHTVYKNSKEIKLSSKEFSMLEYFMRNKDNVLTRGQIINNLWDYNYDTFSNIVDVYVKNLRKKLGDKNNKIIETVHGVGYKINS